MNYNIKKLTPENWKIFKAIRLEALTQEPKYFSPSTDETKRSDEEWRIRLSNHDSAVFALYHQDKVIGLTGIMKDREDLTGETALCVMSYIQKEHRGMGLSGLFYETRIETARKMGYKKLKTAHRKSNEPSRKANQKFGFELVRKENHVWPDGSREDLLTYILNL